MGKSLDSADTDKHRVNIPLKPRLGADTHGFQRLGKDWRSESGIRVTTNIQVGGETADASKLPSTEA